MSIGSPFVELLYELQQSGMLELLQREKRDDRWMDALDRTAKL